MRQIRKKLLLGLICSIFLSVLFSGIGFPVKATSDSFKITVPVRGAYLYVDPRDNSGVESPGIVNLQNNDIFAGDTILISFEGSVDNYGGSDYHTLEYLIGVFSSTNELLSISEADRVPGAINAGDDFDTGETWFSQENTDIPEDFQITPSTGFLIKVPQNAKFLFISMLDSWYPDNTSPTQIAVTIEKQTSESAFIGFPLEYLVVIVIVAIIVVLVAFFMLKRKKPKTQK